MGNFWAIVFIIAILITLIVYETFKDHKENDMNHNDASKQIVSCIQTCVTDVQKISQQTSDPLSYHDCLHMIDEVIVQLHELSMQKSN